MMLSHTGIWRAIDHLAEMHCLSPSGLARRAGLDPTTFNRSKRFKADGRPRWPSTESIAKILDVTRTQASIFFANNFGPEVESRHSSHSSHSGVHMDGLLSPQSPLLQSQVSHYQLSGPGFGEHRGHFSIRADGLEETDYPNRAIDPNVQPSGSAQKGDGFPEFHELPESSESSESSGGSKPLSSPLPTTISPVLTPVTFGAMGDLFALTVSGNFCQPLYDEGDWLLVSLVAPLEVGDRIIACGNTGILHSGCFDGQDGQGLHLRAFSDLGHLSAIAPNELNWVARIMWASQ